MKVLWTGGIGDILAIECFLSPYERSSIDTFFYATRAGIILKELFKALPNYDISEHIEVWSDFSEKFSFTFKYEVIDEDPGKFDELLVDVHDFGIIAQMPQLISYRQHGYGKEYQGSSFIIYTLADISKFKLPSNYITIQPYSPNDGVNWELGKHLDNFDWKNILEYLEEKNMVGIILNNTKYYKEHKFIGTVYDKFNGFKYDIPKHSSLIDLTNKTTILESFEILKKGAGHVGIESCFSVLMSKRYKEGDIFKIKGKTTIEDHVKKLYYYPLFDFDFLVDRITFK